MLDLKSTVTQRRLRSGPAADHIDDFADWLHRQGYRPVTIDTTLRSLAGWTDWMRAAGFTAYDLLEGFASCTAELQVHRRVRHCRGPNHHSLTAAALFIRVGAWKRLGLEVVRFRRTPFRFL